jgi:ABC-type sugar transport system ATPase subunit
MRAEIVRLHRRLGATMIYVTHDQTEAMTMGTRIVVMNGGRIQQAASPMEVYERPANTFVASFIGTPPMNLFPPGVLDLGRTVGVRPENIRISTDGTADGKGLPATVDLVEPLGNETLVHCVTDVRSVKVTVRIQGGAAGGSLVSHGNRIVLLPEMGKAVFFDRDGR